MKALILKRYGGPNQIAFADIPRPVPKADEILVQVHAAGLNPIDNMISKGTFKPIIRMLSRKIIGCASKHRVGYSFLFVRPDGEQLATIAELLQNETIRPVIDQTFPFEQAKEALAYLDKGRAKGKVVVRMK